MAGRLNWVVNLSRGVSLGFVQARIEIGHRLRSWLSIGYFFFPALFLGLSFAFPSFFADREEVIRFILTSAAAAWLAMTGIVTLSSAVIADQDEGVILRAKTLPYGLSGYFVGKIILLSSVSIFGLVLVLIAGEIAVGQVLPRSIGQWGLFALLALLAAASTAPLGAIAGSIARGPLASLPISLVAALLIACSGIFLPVSTMPSWIGNVVPVLPMYWLGELSRLSFGDSSAGLDTTEYILMIGVPVLWAVVALAFVPKAVGALSRRQSGARMQALQARRIARGY